MFLPTERHGERSGARDPTPAVSDICTAAHHAGAIDNHGGNVRVLRGPGQGSYTASTAACVRTSDHGPADASFTFGPFEWRLRAFSNPSHDGRHPRWAGQVVAGGVFETGGDAAPVLGLNSIGQENSSQKQMSAESPTYGLDPQNLQEDMLIGSPSMNKSPGLDAVLGPLRTVERDLRERAKAELADGRAKAEVAKVAESTWKEALRAALKDGEEPPARPANASPGPEPPLPRLAVADTTIEKLAVILAGQPRGTLLARDELAAGCRA